MFRMFNQIFAAITTLFSAAEKGAKSIDNLALIGLRMSETHLAETELEHKARIAALKARLEQPTVTQPAKANQPQTATP